MQMVYGFHMMLWSSHARQITIGPMTTSAKPRGGDTEKMTINLGVIDLGQIDLLVQEGFYSNRSDLIRTAIRAQLQSHAEIVRQAVARRTIAIGLQDYTVQDLERLQTAGQSLRIQALGLVRIAADVSPTLARATIDSISVLGALQCSDAVRSALADRMSPP
jgi:Arc/MetJ-type ribon-helix-helix transcriptional regulator